MTERPDVQLIVNLVIDRGDAVLLERADPSADEGADDRWSIAGAELEPYEHPDEVAASTLADIDGLAVSSIRLAGVQSFRGRRGWHVMFDYHVRAEGDPATASSEFAWFAPDALPRTAHGAFERDTIGRVLAHQPDGG